jgi:hypothetical protein
MPEMRQICDARRRAILFGAMGGLLGGCSHLGSLDLMAQTMRLVGKGRHEDYPRSRAEIDALPYAQLGVARGDGPRAVLVLAEKQGEELNWVSGDRIQVVTRHDRVIRTTGLRSDLRLTRQLGSDLQDFYDAERGVLSAQELLREIAIEPGRHAPVQVRARLQVEQPERIHIHGREVDTLRVVEDLDVPAWRWQARNVWWLDRRSRIAWRSIQHLTPDQPPLHLEALKRAA